MTNFYKTSRWKSKREKILKRDEYLCQECKRFGRSKGASTVHHINTMRNRPDLRLETWNLVSLCNKCHEQMHDRKTDELTDLGEHWRARANRLRGER
ncbi:HNH endonuclease [Neobacillus sp. MM2021_6]|uniref:HNH endonuclease n=1 Tax=Bacillaceae TaxID=186817 RepID=UPI00140792D8|nr:MULTISPECIES: HNH endonuclease [Bacillaceae]MBO0962506.1 HNH endonuclease [Neobacillus sp. MM2021_6]NHC21295.1 HNH endonuclease [Bacillus sp. MM2020_4]